MDAALVKAIQRYVQAKQAERRAGRVWPLGPAEEAMVARNAARMWLSGDANMRRWLAPFFA